MLATVDDLELFRLPSHEEPRGRLVVAELADLVPFRIERLFYIHHVPMNQERGQHAHRLCHQFIICMDGKVVVTVFDGERERELVLSASDCVWIKPGLYATQRFETEDASILVLCDRKYERDDYILSRAEFSKYRAASA